jgi:F-type H+-transporting ATPase subunit delta
MAELRTIARPYAVALFRAAQGADLVAWSNSISEMAQLASLPDVIALAQNPVVSSSQLGETFLSLLKSPTSEVLKSFVGVLVENGRLSILPEINTQFQELKNAAMGVADARIISAFALEETKVKNLVSVLEKKFGRTLNPIVEVDASLIGGVRIEVGDEVLDTSVRAKLQNMQTALSL